MKRIDGELIYTRLKKKLRTYFIMGTVSIMAFVIITTVVLEWLSDYFGWFDNSQIFQYVAIGSTCIAAGVGLYFFTNGIILTPINDILGGMMNLAEGKFDTRLSCRENSFTEPVYNGFNTLAKELQKVEIVQSDFVNNFSHEFKTPLMSINGLIGLMKNKELPREKQLEYLNIIEEETSRLSLLTTNILSISKLENQGIVTDKQRLNVSEQIRTSVLLLERQWTAKKLNLSLDFDEVFVFANEDMLKQVWINILDNAVKFAYEGGELSVGIEKTGSGVAVKIGNTGPQISESDCEKIFNKFYQADKTHSKSGNGIGLSIAKRIVELHNGSISVGRENGMTTFTVTLPSENSR